MKHAGPAAIDALEDLLAVIRAREGVKEKARGVFYRKGKAWLHFHEDPAGLFADVKIGGEWTRFAVDSTVERKALLKRLTETLALPPAVQGRREHRG